MARRPNGRTNGTTNGHHQPKDAPPNRYSIHLTVLFTFIALSLSFLLAFTIGCLSRIFLLAQTGALTQPMPTSTDVTFYQPEHKTMSGKRSSTQLPSPKVLEGKDVPYTTYTSKTFSTAATVTANTLHIDRSTAVLLMTGKSSKPQDGGPELRDTTPTITTVQNSAGDGGGEWTTCAESPDSSCSRGKVVNHVNTMGHNSDADEEHLPAGQHLLIDLKDVSSSFLNSETRLAEAMISLINESRLTLLSYHCHSLVPIGVSCAGVLLESHVAFHTWPVEGVITLELFTCGGMPLIPVLPLVEKLFGVERERGEVEDGEEVVLPSMLWAHKVSFASFVDRETRAACMAGFNAD
jgi:S-adenosylmethionine/arginine decarboxylase-like enzyme